MIVVYEITWPGLLHSPGNIGLVRMACQAYPDQKVWFIAEREQMAEMERQTAADGFTNLRMREIAIPPLEAGPYTRLRIEARSLFESFRSIDDGGPCLLIHSSITGTAAFVTDWMMRLRRGDSLRVLSILHGNANALGSWHPRNPVRHYLQLSSAVARYRMPRYRYAVIERSTRDALLAAQPSLAGMVDYFPHTVDPAETHSAEAPAATPVRFGFLGLATRAKGFPQFLALARAAGTTHGEACSFHLIGRLHREMTGEDLSVLTGPASETPLPRTDYLAGVAALHYVVLPYAGEYYRAAASGVLFDAIANRKPVIAMRFPFVEQLFEEYGDIGELCDDEAGMLEAVCRAATAFDQDRYAAQAQRLQRIGADRDPAKLAGHFKRVVEQGFPGLLERRAA